MSHLNEYEKKTFQSVAMGALSDLDFAQDATEKAALEKKDEAYQEEYKDVLTKMKDILKDKVKDVRFSHRLKSSPSCIVADEGQMTTQMQRLLKQAGQSVSLKPILELNPEHLLVQQLKTDADPKHFEDLSQILLDQAVLAKEGSSMILLALSVSLMICC